MKRIDLDSLAGHGYHPSLGLILSFSIRSRAMVQGMTRPVLGLAFFVLAPLAGCHVAQSSRVTESPRPADVKAVAEPPPSLESPYAAMKNPVAGEPPVTTAAAVKKADSKDARWPEYTSPPPPAPLPTLQAELVTFPKDGDQHPPRRMLPIDTTPKHPIVLALECVLDNRHDEVLRHLDKYDARTQEFLLRILPTLALVSKNNQLGPTELAALGEQITNIRNYLQMSADFAIAKVVFCESIKGYAIYKPVAEGHEFIAARSDRPGEIVQLYVELKNFASNPVAGLFETRLSSRVDILDENGQKKWSHRFQPDELKLVSRTRLAEYYHNFTFALPASLPPGTYSLAVEMTDETHVPPRTTLATVPFRIASPKE